MRLGSSQADLVNSVARDYIACEHTPYHASYAAFVRGTLNQWQALLDAGYTFERCEGITPSKATYESSSDMFAELDSARHLRVDTFGQVFAPDNPMAHVLPNGFSVNEIFRAVHDINGHYLTREPFETFDGELRAYLNHSKMYSNEAIPALFGETIGQLCHYYSGAGFVPTQECKVLNPQPIQKRINRRWSCTAVRYTGEYA